MQSEKQILKSQDRDSLSNKRLKKKTLLGGTIIAIVIIVSPYFFWIYEALPGGAVWESPFGTISSNYYGNIQVFFWTLFNKLVPLLLLLIWFFTCKHWWYHAIIIPICTLTFQTYQIINDEVSFVDASEFIFIIPMICIVAIFVYSIRLRVFDKIYGIDYDELSRVNWKGKINTAAEDVNSDANDDEDDEPLFMG